MVVLRASELEKVSEVSTAFKTIQGAWCHGHAVLIVRKPKKIGLPKNKRFIEAEDVTVLPSQDWKITVKIYADDNGILKIPETGDTIRFFSQKHHESYEAYVVLKRMAIVDAKLVI